MPLLPTFKRAKAPSDDYWYYPVGVQNAAGVPVDEHTAIKYLTVSSCVSLIAGDIGRLPLNLYRKRADGGKDLVTDHKLYDLLHNAPNQSTTSFSACTADPCARTCARLLLRCVRAIGACGDCTGRRSAYSSVC